MIEWYKKVVFQNYSNFEGRARRAEYWNYVLVNFLISIPLNLVDWAIGINILSGIYSLAVFLPGLAVSVRRLHDVNKSGWFILLALIPIIGWIWLIVLLATEGNRGANEYGPDPKNSETTFDFDNNKFA